MLLRSNAAASLGADGKILETSLDANPLGVSYRAGCCRDPPGQLTRADALDHNRAALALETLDTRLRDPSQADIGARQRIGRGRQNNPVLPRSQRIGRIHRDGNSGVAPNPTYLEYPENRAPLRDGRTGQLPPLATGPVHIDLPDG